LQVDVEIKGNALSVGFAIDLCAALPDGFAGRLNAQIQALDLNPRYGREVNTYISGHAIALHSFALSHGSEGVRDFLQLQARYETTRFYRNHWRPVLLRALAAHTPFIEGGFAIVLPVPQDMVDDISGIQTEKTL
jgi:hypothetical protein